MAIHIGTVLVTVLLIRFSYEKSAPRVQTKLGAVVGTEREGEDGQIIYSYEGIPYIKPPVGQLRFKPPQPADAWDGDFSATSDMAICTQKLFGPKMGTEDCIILNVHTPWNPSTPPPSKPLSVMVFIHGGGFVGGASNTMFGGYPDYLLRHDVVLVTINYRLGVMGFLSTEDEAAPGNYGLLDQVEALKCIKNNIGFFGGNPNDVTIFGESAGAGSVHLLMLSPLAKDLFHRAIAQSGSSTCPWSVSRTARRNAKILARKVGCPEEPSRELVECLRGKDADVLVSTDIVEPDQRVGVLPFGWAPRVDAEATQPFLPGLPIDLITSGDYHKVPLLIGHTRTEGAGFMLMGKEMYDLNVDSITNNWHHYCKLSTSMRELLVPEKMGSELCDQVKQAYIDESKSFEQNKISYADLLGDVMMTSGIYKSSELMSVHSPVYNYVLNYESKEYFIMKLFFPESQKVDGVVSHGDDLMYLFKYPQTGWTKESPEYHMVEMMSQIWTDFAKTGKPSISKMNASWPKASWPDHQYVVIDSEPSIQQNYKPDKMKMMNEVFSQFVYKPITQEKDEL